MSEETDVTVKTEHEVLDALGDTAAPPSSDGVVGGAADEEGSGANDLNDEQSPKSFPQKLFDVLEDESHADVISWCPHGNSFRIHKKKCFAQTVLPRFFKASKFTSFTRKLNRWGFNRIPRGPETGSYFHKLFRRDKPELAAQMTSNSGTKYSSAPMHNHILPTMPGMVAAGAMPQMGMFPYMGHAAMPANGTPQQQQQQAMWQQQMQVRLPARKFFSFATNSSQQMQMLQMQHQMQVMHSMQAHQQMPMQQQPPQMSAHDTKSDEPAIPQSADDVGGPDDVNVDAPPDMAAI